MQPLVINPQLDTGEGRLAVARAWFEGIDDGLRRLSFEGRDGEGQVRAGRIWFDDRAQPARVALLPHGRDRRLPALERLSERGELLVHRAGRRGVLRTAEGFTKVVRPGKVADAEARARLFAEAGGPLTTPKVLSSSADGELTVDVVPGVSLHGLAAGEPAAWAAGWAAWAGAWPEAVRHGAPQSALGQFTVADEARTLAGWLERVEAARPTGLGPTLRPRFEAVMAALTALPEPRWTLSHRDLHDKQILVTPAGSVGLIDSDTLALADPALDLGNLLAHVELRARQGLVDGYQAAHAVELIRGVADALEVPTASLAAWRDSAALRLTCVYALRPIGATS